MKNIRVISRKILPSKLPVFETLCLVMALDYYNAPQWLMGAVGLYCVIRWIATFIAISKEKQINILEYYNEDFHKE